MWRSLLLALLACGSLLAGEPLPVMWGDLTDGLNGRQVRVHQLDGTQVSGYIHAFTAESIRLCSKRLTTSGTCPGDQRTVTREQIGQLCLRGPRAQSLQHLARPFLLLVGGISMGFLPDMPWWVRPGLAAVGTAEAMWLSAVSVSTAPVSIPHEWIRSKRNTCFMINATTPYGSPFLRDKRRDQRRRGHVPYCSMRILDALSIP